MISSRPTKEPEEEVGEELVAVAGAVEVVAGASQGVLVSEDAPDQEVAALSRLREEPGPGAEAGPGVPAGASQELAGESEPGQGPGLLEGT